MSEIDKHEGVVVQQRKGGKIRRCFRRFWWACLGAAIIIALIVVLLIIYVAFPKISQQSVDASTINITSLQVLDPTANSVHMIQDTIISSDSQFHPYLDPFNVSIALQGSDPYALMELPGTNSGENVPVHVDQVIDITNMDAFKQYNAALMSSEKITQYINGSTWLHEGSLPADNVNYDKNVDLVGFNSLKGLNITKFTVLSKALSNGTNAQGEVLIPNPTVLTIAMGNVTFDQYVPKDPSKPGQDMVHIGNSTLVNFLFEPGNKTYPMSAIVDQNAVAGLITGNYASGILPITIVGKSSIYNGVHLEYYEAALMAANQTVTLNAIAALSGSS